MTSSSQLTWNWILDWERLSQEERDSISKPRYVPYGGVDISSVFDAHSVAMNQELVPYTILILEPLWLTLTSYSGIAVDAVFGEE